MQRKSHVAYGMSFGVITDGSGYIQQQRFDGDPVAYSLLFQPRSGHVGIGTSFVTPLFGRTLQIGSADQENTVNLVGPISAGFLATFQDKMRNARLKLGEFGDLPVDALDIGAHVFELTGESGIALV